MASLPQFQSDDRTFQMMQNQWATTLNPIITRAQNNSLILKSISLQSGANSINHLLGRKLQGWKIVRQRAAASIYDDQDSNPTPNLTLALVSDADVVVDLEVF